MKKVGLRTIKTAISIAICLLIFLGLKCFELIDGVPESFAFMVYNPFFASIATAYSLHSNKNKSIEQAKNRCVASVIGGAVGITLVLLFELISQKNWPSMATASVIDFIIPYTLVALFSILVIVIGVAVKQKPAIFVAVLTFLSITVNANATISNNWGEWVFGLNRILSTVIGVLIALGVNLFRLPHLNKNKDLLFVIGIEDILPKENDKLGDYMSYKLNDLVFNDINCTIFTTRTPVTFMHLLNDVKINNPVVCCSGAALYDPKELKYLYKEEIAYEDSIIIDKYLDSLGVTPFKNYIIEDVLYTYCKKIDNPGEKLYMDSKKNAPYCNFYLGENNNKNNVLYYLLVESENKVNTIIDELQNGPLKDRITIQVYDYFENSELVSDLKYIKIYSKEIEKLNVLKNYTASKNYRIVSLTTNEMANHLLDSSDIAVTYEDNKSKEAADVVLKSNSYDLLFKQIAKIYYDKKYHK